MAQPSNEKAIILKDVDLEFEGDNYGAFASSVIFTPSSSAETFQGMTPGSLVTDSAAATWDVAITYVQDWEGDKSFSKYLYRNASKRKVCKFKPRQGAGLPAFTSTVAIAHGAIGGAGGKFPTATATMSCTEPALDSDDDEATPEPEAPVGP